MKISTRRIYSYASLNILLGIFILSIAIGTRHIPFLKLEQYLDTNIRQIKHAGSAFNQVSAQPLKTFPAQTTDISIRFQHIESFYNYPSLIAHWSMDEGSGYECLDYSGKKNTAYITGSQWNIKDSGLTASFRRKGKRAGCVFLNGTQWLQVKDMPQLNTSGQLTLGVWVKPDKSTKEMAEKALISKMAAGKGYMLQLEKNNTVSFTILDENSKTYTVQTTANRLSPHNWTYLLATVDAAQGKIHIYINGELAGSTNTKAFTPGYAAVDLTIGQATQLKSGFNGWIDEVTILDKSLMLQEIQQLYTVGLPKVYTQTRETMDADKSIWTHFKGNQPVPHPTDEHAVFSLNFDGSLSSAQGHKPVNYPDSAKVYVPGEFGGAFNGLKSTGILSYTSPLTQSQGSFEAWFTPVFPIGKPSDADKKHTLFRAEGKDIWMELYWRKGRWIAETGGNDKTTTVIQSPDKMVPYGKLIHLGVTWGKANNEGRELALFINGVEVDRKPTDIVPLFNQTIQFGGKNGEKLSGYLDDVRISSDIKDWKTICPRGHVDTESAALDLMQSFNMDSNEPLLHWKAATTNAQWSYASKKWEDDGRTLGDSGDLRHSLQQSNPKGIHPVFHPDAYGYMSSIEAGISFDKAANGWAGIFVQADEPSEKALNGHNFTINPGTRQIRLATMLNGSIIATKTLPYDFPMVTRQTYTLTLSSVDGILRGYIDGHNFISMTDTSGLTKGYAGLITDNIAAYFDDVHFSALTPSSTQSRKIEQRLFSDGGIWNIQPEYEQPALHAFRWKKRYGLLPWHRTYKNPEPPANLFGPTDSVLRPNPTQYWRSEDAANSDILTVNGKMYYFMRGNPDCNGPHGPSSLGTMFAQANTFDGIHFNDQNAGKTDLDQMELLRGHIDTNKECADKPPRENRFQVNDEGAVYQDGKILVFAREFRNRVRPYPGFRRLVFGIFDIKAQKWDQQVPHLVEWSAMDPNNCQATFSGYNATPEVASLRDPVTNEYVIFLYHGRRTPENVSTTGIVGLRYDGRNVVLHPDYPAKDSYTKHNKDGIYGERIFFDNGIYYMHVNAGSDEDKLKRDWPDRFQLFTSLHPYASAWNGSSENTNTNRPYFTRGGEFDSDNGAIWQGTMFKYRNRYYMYYENFHVIENINQQYDNYDHTQSGSRIGFATGN